LRALLTWRDFQTINQTDIDKMIDPSKGERERAVQGEKEKERLRVMVKKRHQICVDYTFLKVVLPVVSTISNWTPGQSQVKGNLYYFQTV
jgi:hypothetical protein